MRIGELAKLAGVSVATVRYYERLGLLREAARSPSGYRDFAPDALRRLAFVHRAQALGFSLPEVRQLMDLRRRPGAPAADVRAQVEAKIVSVEGKIAELESLRQALWELRSSCCSAVSTGDCPILDALEGATGSLLG